MAGLNPYQQQKVIGLLPAAGQATRLAPLPSSKELYPVGFQRLADGSLRPKVVCHYLLEKMRLADIRQVYILLRSGKWDIPAYLGDGSLIDMHLGYLIVRLLYGVAYTLDQAYPFVQDAIVAFGFPDILFQPEDAFQRLLARQAATQADVVLGLVPFEPPHKGGMVKFDAQGRVQLVVEKPEQSDLRHSWFIAVWTPVFTEFLHQHLVAIETLKGQREREGNPLALRELPIGDVIQAAIESGLRVEAEVFPEGHFLDIGTPGDLVRAVQNFATEIE